MAHTANKLSNAPAINIHKSELFYGREHKVKKLLMLLIWLVTLVMNIITTLVSSTGQYFEFDGIHHKTINPAIGNGALGIVLTLFCLLALHNQPNFKHYFSSSEKFRQHLISVFALVITSCVGFVFHKMIWIYGYDIIGYSINYIFRSAYIWSPFFLIYLLVRKFAIISGPYSKNLLLKEINELSSELRNKKTHAQKTNRNIKSHISKITSYFNYFALFSLQKNNTNINEYLLFARSLLDIRFEILDNNDVEKGKKLLEKFKGLFLKKFSESTITTAEPESEKDNTRNDRYLVMLINILDESSIIQSMMLLEYSHLRTMWEASHTSVSREKADESSFTTTNQKALIKRALIRSQHYDLLMCNNISHLILLLFFYIFILVLGPTIGTLTNPELSVKLSTAVWAFYALSLFVNSLIAIKFLRHLQNKFRVSVLFFL